MSNTVIFGQEARKKLKAGIDKVARTAMPTLGASGGNVAYNKWSRVPIITNDGVSAAREVEPDDLGELQGANLIKQVSERTDDEVGDGTTTSIVLAHSIITDGMALLDDERNKVNPMRLRREIVAASVEVIKALDACAVKETDQDKLAEIATISVEDPEIGNIITQAIFDAGDDGIVYVNDSDKVGVKLEKVEGYQIPAGLISPGLVTDLTKMEAVLNDVAIIITDMPVKLDEDFIRLISEITKTKSDILLMGNDIHPLVVQFAVANTSQHKFRMSIIKKPMQIDYMEDVAALTGAYAMTQDKGKFKIKSEYVGQASKVVVNQHTTTITGGAGIESTRYIDGELSIDGISHIANLKKQYEVSTDEVTKTKLQERIARLTEKVYMLNVGEKTEAEQKYLRMKVDDAVNAVKAAKDDGIVAGGGMALWNIGKNRPDGEITDGAKIVYDACLAPMRQIVTNAGAEYDKVVDSMIGDESGFNALTLDMETSMIGAGIIDPVKVTKNAFTNASSFAALLLTIEALVIPNKQESSGLER